MCRGGKTSPHADSHSVAATFLESPGLYAFLEEIAPFSAAPGSALWSPRLCFVRATRPGIIFPPCTPAFAMPDTGARGGRI